MEDGQVSHSWCMCVVSHGCDGLDGGRDGGGGWYACRTNARGLGAFREILKHFLSAW